jgi:TolB-like protein/Tfp pilus assembly protein PilF
MKRCPECRRDYYDDSLHYCLDDGAELLEGPASADDPATAILSTPGAVATGSIPSEAPTRTLDPYSDPASSVQVPHQASPRNTMIVVGIGAFLVAVLSVGSYIYFGRSATKQIESIAVMPFVNASGNPDIEYLSDGMTETMISSLSQLPQLNVKAPSSVFRYKGKDTDAKTIGNELSVQAILNGRIVQRGDELGIYLSLVDAATENQIWGEQYNRKLGTLAALQTEIARDVSRKLRQRLTGEQEKSVTRNQTQNTEAYQLYLQGRYHWNKRTADASRKAIEYFQQAIEKDPQYAMAYVGLADSYITLDVYRQSLPKIVAAAEKALEIDPTLGEAHAALANVWWLELDFERAEKEFRRAIELSPNYATAYHWLGEYLVLQGRFDEGFAAYNKALELDPYSFAISTDLGIGYYYARQYDRAIDHLKKLIEMDPNYVRTHFYLAHVYEEKGMFEDATREYDKGLILSGDDPGKVAEDSRKILNGYKASGARGYWQLVLEYFKEERPSGKRSHRVDMAITYARLGERDEAFAWIEKALEVGEGGGMGLKVSPAWDNLRGDPRFQELLRRVGFPD